MARRDARSSYFRIRFRYLRHSELFQGAPTMSSQRGFLQNINIFIPSPEVVSAMSDADVGYSNFDAQTPNGDDTTAQN